MKLYRTLNCTMTSTFLEIEDSYKRLVKEVHPQRNPKETQRYYEINSAYDILRDNYKREFYDLYGEQAITILQNREVGFAISRVFFRNNLIAFILFSIICIFNLMFLPMYIYLYQNSPSVSYSIYIIPFFISTCLFVFPIRKSLKLIGKMIEQLFKMIIVLTNLIIIATEILLVCLYADRLISGLTGAIAVLILELVSIAFSFYSQKKLLKLQGMDVNHKISLSKILKEPRETLIFIIRQLTWSLSILSIFIAANQILIKGPLSFCGIYFYLLLLDVPLLIRIIISLPLILYSTTFCLAVAGFKSYFIFFSLILLGIAIISGAYVAFNYLPKTRMRYKEL
ncbi:Mitochondrial protein import protein mas5, partial [Nosema bombycis CQ1]